MKYLVAVVFSLSLSGCIGASGISPEYETAISCRAYASTLRLMAPFKKKMSATQILTVDKARAIISPVCKRASEGITGLDNLTAVRDAMTKMMIIQKEIK